VSDLTATDTGDEYGIYMISQFGIIRHNVVTDDTKPSEGGTSYGIPAVVSQTSVVVNSLTNLNYGIYFGNPGISSRNTAACCNVAFFGGAGSDNDHD
jgi:hypothetical protein